ncbi:MAG TPA: IS701 family transposase [Terriglobales bacterium]|nr:IS701 family transposase [Terriglobales bacterium]
MNQAAIKKLSRELDAFIEQLTSDMGRPERRAAMGLYLTGLLLDGERKSIEPMAARLVDSADEVQAMRQRLQQCVVVAEWAEKETFARIAGMVEHEMPDVEALVLDDTGFAKKGTHSVGVQRQYSGTLGRTENCQVATSLHLAGEVGSACIGMRLYLPESWASDPIRRRKAGIPDDVQFAEKWRIALALLDDAFAAGVRKHVVLADAGYGDIGDFRRELAARDLRYVVGVAGKHVVWPPAANPQRKAIDGGKHVAYVDKRHPPITIADFAETLSYRRVRWRDGTRGVQRSRFAATRVRLASEHRRGRPPGEPVWLLSWWPEEESKPAKFWLSNLPAGTSIKRLVQFAKLRWRIERDYQEMKGELGLDHFEGRTWRGFHHHAALCAAAHAFLALRRALFPPEQDPLDPPFGQTSPAAGTAAPAAFVSAVRPPDYAGSTTAGVLTDVIE